MEVGYFAIDGKKYKQEFDTDAGLELYTKLQNVNAKLQELANLQVVLVQAKNSYMSELKDEVIRSKTGIDLGQIFAPDQEKNYAENKN